ncbi:ATP-binding protein [Curtobacterium aurantiacum]|uniref:ATP-binding protein n=1 Tax=Curtobacterium aurantiacum TaxID=3236919 RepID=A0ABS5VHD5_9MICO|nr:ATP-binding protein [Curtobacterium flaccumfaciens]MBT1546420.1 ATP-binding protein [Curtobacterium flaccumfaciens pv. flaccumfaciens]MBT1588904.1 ATP-binding protein [Curtobacterium flaccumfaciens pv. flaccumfaciens]
MSDDVVGSKSVFAGPAKRMFIDVLTRDVSLIPAILDLVDNSVDSANALLRAAADSTDAPDGLKLRIDISAYPDRFEVRDNCEGITLEAAEGYVFALGRPEEGSASQQTGSIGRFGVGMKRTLFKIADSFTVRSATADTLFKVDLDIEDWMSKRTEEGHDDWYIQLDVLRRGDDEPRGTTVQVNELQTWVTDAFSDAKMINRLREELRSRHRMAIERGIEMRLNGTPLKPLPSQVSAGGEIAPGYRRFAVDSVDGGAISVEIFAGMVKAVTHRGTDEEPEDGEEAERAAGWYVFGNGRLIVGPDRSDLTGWAGGRDLPRYHNQYSRFRGYVLMTADDVRALPWTTDKTGIEPNDRAWIKIRREMVNLGRQVVSHLNAIKRETGAPDEVTDRPLSAALDDPRTKTVTISDLQGSLTSDQPAAAPPENPAARHRGGVRIAYAVDEDEFSEVAAGLDADTKKAVGERTFSYYLNNVVRGVR